MEAVLHERVVGQERGRRRAVEGHPPRSGLKDPNPAGSFIFLGLGRGKTELSKALAEFLFNSEDALLGPSTCLSTWRSTA